MAGASPTAPSRCRACYRVNSALFRHWPPTQSGRRAHGLLTSSTVYQLKSICVSSMKLCANKRPVFHMYFRCRSCTDYPPLSKGVADSDCCTGSFQSCRQSRSESVGDNGGSPSELNSHCDAGICNAEIRAVTCVMVLSNRIFVVDFYFCRVFHKNGYRLKWKLCFSQASSRVLVHNESQACLKTCLMSAS